MDSNKNTLRVVAQLTFSKRIIDLVAEEDFYPYKKGDIVRKINRNILDKMERPLNVRVMSGGG